MGIYAFADPPVLGEARATACADAHEPTTMTKYYYSSLMERYEEQVQQYARASMRPIIDDDARSLDFPGGIRLSCVGAGNSKRQSRAACE